MTELFEETALFLDEQLFEQAMDEVVHACCICEVPDGIQAICGVIDLSEMTYSELTCPVCIELARDPSARCPKCGIHYINLEWG